VMAVVDAGRAVCCTPSRLHSCTLFAGRSSGTCPTRPLLCHLSRSLRGHTHQRLTPAANPSHALQTPHIAHLPSTPPINLNTQTRRSQSQRQGHQHCILR
jgi:hypothetical protein